MNEDTSKDLILPGLSDCNSEPMIQSILSQLNLPRSVLANPENIEIVWDGFKTILPNVHPEYRDELLARMVIAVRVGLFPGAINEIWNLTIIALRTRIKKFGYSEAKSFLKRDIDEAILKDIKDHELLDTCVKLGLLGERDYFFLIQNKEIRNNYSSAHPAEGGMLDGHELTGFVNRCVQYVLCKVDESVGINIHNFIETLKSQQLPDSELDVLAEKISNSFRVQRSGIIIALFGIYCDPESDEFVRDNCAGLLTRSWDNVDEATIAEILSLYSGYSISDHVRRDQARALFSNLGKLDLLPREERFHILHRAIKALESAHQGMDNFYTEVPLAENLSLIYKSLPEGLYAPYVNTVSTCYVGNVYGTSWGAETFYSEMIGNFNSRQIDLLVQAYLDDTLLRNRVRGSGRCRAKFTELVTLLSERNIPAQSKPEIDRIKSGTFR